MRERITVDANYHFGKPCVAGTRIPVQSVLEPVQEGAFQEIIHGDYPDLVIEDIRGCMPYATDTIAGEDIQIALPSRIWVQESFTFASYPQPETLCTTNS